MHEPAALTLRKEERLSGMTLVESLFNKDGSRSMSAFPLRMVYAFAERDEVVPPVRILTSVPKRNFKHAVDRNRVKRQLREAYRHNKGILGDANGKSLLVAFIWMDNRHYPSRVIEGRMRKLLYRLSERL